jgi:hypothetical protein
VVRASRSAARLDLAVSGALLLIGAFQFAFCEAGTAFHSGDTSYLELARSIVGRHLYGFDFRAETMLPPGFPAVLALLQLAVGESHLRLVRVMVVTTTAAFLVTYVLLRRMAGRRVAAGICLLLAASPLYFRFASTMVFSDMPYFVTSMAALWAIDRADQSRLTRPPAGLLGLAAVLIGASVLMRTSGIALVAGMVAWIAATFWFDRQRGAIRLKAASSLVVCGILVQLAWTSWATPRQFSEWPIGGYPKPYLAQLIVKNGNEPDLGYASLTDVPARIVQNITDRAAGLDYLATGKTGSSLITPRWFLPWIFGPIVLVVIGLVRSVRQSGGTLAEWYFIVHEAIYLLWPWDFESRFFLPVAPLAFLYAWRGARYCLAFTRRRLAWGGPDVRQAMARGAVALLFLLVTNGIVLQTDVARQNRAFDLSQSPSYPDIQAAQWIQTHVPGGSVVMARQWDIAYHYAARKVVWFPPTTNADVLLNGILKYHVDYVVVVARGDGSYWRPDDDRCFKSLVDRYPELFAVVQAGNREKVYAVTIRRS